MPTETRWRSTGVGARARHGGGESERNVTYTPVAGYNGPDGFTYAISDGQGGTATSAVVVDVAGLPNLAPMVNAGPDQALTFPTATATCRARPGRRLPGVPG